MRGRVLILDDDEALCALLSEELARARFHPLPYTDAAVALAALDRDDPDVVLTDLALKGGSGIDVCRTVVERRPGVPVVVLTGFGTMETAIAAIRAGAYDFLPKPADMQVLTISLDRAVHHRRLTDEVRRLRAAAASAARLDDLVGESAVMQKLFEQIERIGPTESSVFVHGESGTGKELVARALHRGSRRAKGPFVAINCGAVPEALLESELFGHTRGAFTDARAARAGLFVSANGGTLFLDEIGDLPLSLQVKLLRVLQERRLRPVGSDEEVAIDVRVLSASHRDPESMVEAGTFRDDLRYRLEVIRLEVPPLRARATDVLLLAQQFVEVHANRSNKRVIGIAQAAARKLLDYDWPGNVRELQNCIERAVALTAFDRITVDDLPPRVGQHEPTSATAAVADPAAMFTMEEVERRYVAQVLATVHGNKASAARVLGFDRKTLYRKLERYGLG